MSGDFFLGSASVSSFAHGLCSLLPRISDSLSVLMTHHFQFTEKVTDFKGCRLFRI